MSSIPPSDTPSSGHSDPVGSASGNGDAPREPSAVAATLGAKRFLLACLAATLLAMGAAAAYIFWQWHHFMETPPETPGHEVRLMVPQGATFDRVTAMLEREGLITNPEFFRLLGKMEQRFGSIQAGEFDLHTGWTPTRILETLVSGRPVLYRLSIREGLTWWQTAALVQEAGYGDVADYEAAIRDKKLLQELHIPFDTAEGFLFPETYMLKRPTGQDARRVVEHQIRHFWHEVSTIWPNGRPDPKTLKQVVILASLVEKETAAPEERRRIAGVYANRLKRRMLLQCDPTVIYGLGTAFDGNLKRTHLNDKSNPYNTYRHAGLPPGPICSPGLEALKAAADPEQHKYLYFVAKKDGTHYFSKSLKEHNRAVRKYQLRRK